jgi:DNA invertase Pin-like site-specific DNA recombinase
MHNPLQNGSSKMPVVIGYARVSTDGQSVADQVATLKAAGASKVFSEKASGAKTDRPALARTIKSLGAGDTLLVCRLDRLARSTRDLLNTLHTVGEAGASFRSLGDSWADTTTAHGRLMLTILGGLAEFERSLIASRCDAGIKRARAAGIRFGRKPKLTTYQKGEAVKLRDAGQPQRLIAQTFNVSQATISRLG